MMLLQGRFAHWPLCVKVLEAAQLLRVGMVWFVLSGVIYLSLCTSVWSRAWLARSVSKGILLH